MELIERNPLPTICKECIAQQEATGEYDDCYNCDNALDRWEIRRTVEPSAPALDIPFSGNKDEPAQQS